MVGLFPGGKRRTPELKPHVERCATCGKPASNPAHAFFHDFTAVLR